MKLGNYSMNKQRAGIIIRFGLSILLIVLLFSLIDVDHFIQHIRNLNPIYFLVGLVVYFVAIGFSALRWYLFIRATNEPVGFSRVFGTTLIGIFFSLFLPTMVGTDLGRMYELSRGQKDKVSVVSTVVLDRLMGLVTLVLMALVAVIIGVDFTGELPVNELVIGAAALMLVGWLVFFNRALMYRFSWVLAMPLVKQFDPTIRSLYNTLHFLQSQPRLLLSTFVVSLLNQFTEVVSVILIAMALGVQVPIVHFFVFMPIVWLVTMIPISISGLGLREGAFAFFFTQVGVTGAEAVAISLIFYFYSVVVGVIGGLLLTRSSFAQAIRPLINQKFNRQPVTAEIE
jgi:glycosyltransferase 2 family protein